MEQTPDSHDNEYVEDNEDFSTGWLRRSSFEIDQLVSVVRDLFIAGVDTTATTLTWILLYLSKYPEFQRKMQSEIDDVLGQSGVPKMATMEKMPYVRAVIQVSNFFVLKCNQIQNSVLRISKFYQSNELHNQSQRCNWRQDLMFLR